MLYFLLLNTFISHVLCGTIALDLPMNSVVLYRMNFCLLFYLCILWHCCIHLFLLFYLCVYGIVEYIYFSCCICVFTRLLNTFISLVVSMCLRYCWIHLFLLFYLCVYGIIEYIYFSFLSMCLRYYRIDWFLLFYLCVYKIVEYIYFSCFIYVFTRLLNTFISLALSMGLRYCWIHLFLLCLSMCLQDCWIHLFLLLYLWVYGIVRYIYFSCFIYVFTVL